MKKNVGRCDAMLRITLGLMGLAYCIARTNRRRRFPWTTAFLSAMKVAEGIMRYCPMLALFGKNTKGFASFFKKKDPLISLNHQPE
ncbi:Protein of unknown function [Seinonella peptonophila]|uniref:Inner membrane protein YgaP-like transmembrane domain-containing protein n=1 Tax=Seinonella peptonophila TaxID=112248 RepID=A0A1M4ZI69_9BACL|nr:DUF2892 domain-containing protein [Seinonella peptonophila]SHF17492.1 Protein of unknown function [Seinonella peptonophila]